MGSHHIVFAAVGAAAVIVGCIFCTYQLYRLVELDAECRGLKHPKLWGMFASASNGNSGLILYLIGRRNYPILSISEEQMQCKEKRKKKFGVGLVFLAVGAVTCALSIWLM